MFEYLIHIEPRLYDRYLTVERNIKSASNSFYDSYLDMQEQFVKTVILAAGIDFKPNETCGALLKKQVPRSLGSKQIVSLQKIQQPFPSL